MKNQDMEDKSYVLDSSAFLTLFEDEKGADTVQELLELAKKGKLAIFVCFATFTEVFYITFREQGREEAQKRVKLMASLEKEPVKLKTGYANFVELRSAFEATRGNAARMAMYRLTKAHRVAFERICRGTGM